MESVREVLQGQKMEIILQLNHDLAEARRIVRYLLYFTGRRGFCPRCGARVFYINGLDRLEVRPHNDDGNRHSDTCPGKFPEEEENHE